MLTIADYNAVVEGLNRGFIVWDVVRMGTLISRLIETASEGTSISKDDLRLRVIEAREGEAGVAMRVHITDDGPIEVRNVLLPATMEDSVLFGTAFFDALAYYSLPVADRPIPYLGTDHRPDAQGTYFRMKQSLCWMALYIMLRGSWFTGDGIVSGTDVPAFLLNTFGLVGTPAAMRARLASFDLIRVPCEWVKYIRWANLSPKIRQRLGLSLAGYRQLNVLRFYEPKVDCTAIVRINIEWVRAVLSLPRDWGMVSATRNPDVIAQAGSINRGVDQLLAEGYSDEDVQLMVQNKSIYRAPIRDVTQINWKVWYLIPLELFNDPVDLAWGDYDAEWEDEASNRVDPLVVETIRTRWMEWRDGFIAENNDLAAPAPIVNAAQGGGGGGNMYD